MPAIRSVFVVFSCCYLLSSATALAQAPVAVAEVESSRIVARIPVSGSVTSPRRATLSTAVPGLVATLAVDDGARVAAGDVLLSLDAELAEIGLEQAGARVRQNEVALADAARRLAEAEEVGRRRAIAQTEIESLRAEVASDEAALAASRAAAREQAALLERHTLKAPFTGVISGRQTELGEWVNPGDGLFELIATEDLRFDFRVPQDYFRQVTVDTPVRVSLDALPDTPIMARIAAVVPVNSPGARTFLVRSVAQVGEIAGGVAVTPGMSVGGMLEVDAEREAPVVSRDAVLRFPDGRVTVWILDYGTEVPTVRERAVSTGLEFDGMVEIVEGLSEGDVVVTRGNETLADGQTVRIVNSG
ncbi:MAG: efflux RND transporter periplasmic adaptor subunit [Pseudomonadota bacterium]